MIRAQIEQVRRQSRSAEAHGSLGTTYEANELWSLALASYRNAAQLAPDNPSWVYRQALCHLRLDQTSEAELLLATINRQHPGFAPAWYRRGRAALARGEVDAALAHFEKCRALVPDDAAARAAVADCWIRQRRFAEAVRILEPIVASHSDFAHARFLLGMAYRGLGEREQALAAMKGIVDTGPWHVLDEVDRRVPALKVGLSSVVDNALELLEAGRAEEAARMLEELTASHPNEVSVINNLASAYQQLGRYREALALLNKARDLDPANFRTYLNRASCLISMQDYRRALESARAAVSLAPQVALAHMTLARALLLLQEVTEAKTVLERVIELEPDKVEARLALGELAMAAQNFREACTHLTIVSEQEPRHLPSLVNLGLAQLFLGDLDAAQACLRRAETIQADHPKVRGLAIRLEQARKTTP
ncbi:MAG: tetratricopeptide repeat protein [Planctomycetota bacterium]